MISRNQGAWFSCETASERDLRLPRLHASMHRGEIRLQILRYHMMHHKDGSFFVQGSSSLTNASTARLDYRKDRRTYRRLSVICNLWRRLTQKFIKLQSRKADEKIDEKRQIRWGRSFTSSAKDWRRLAPFFFWVANTVHIYLNQPVCAASLLFILFILFYFLILG